MLYNLDISIIKQEFRKEYYRRFKEQSKEALKKQHRLLEERLWYFYTKILSSNKSRILIYQNLPSEIPVVRFVEKSPAVIFYPVCFGKKLFAKKERLFLPLYKMDLILVPCLLFNSEGYRLGRGGGYYDRSLRFLPCKKTLLLVRHWQKEEKIPIAEHDIPLRYWLSDKEISFFVKF